MRPLFVRTALSLVVAGLAVAAFTATSGSQRWVTWEGDTITVQTFTDTDGIDDGLVTAVVFGDGYEQGELRIIVSGDEVRRSLKVSAADESREPDRVKKTYTITRGLPGSCEDDGDTDDTDTGPGGACTVVVPLRFEGSPGWFDDVKITASLGNYEDTPRPQGEWIVTVDYDSDPPAE